MCCRCNNWHILRTLRTLHELRAGKRNRFSVFRHHTQPCDCAVQVAHEADEHVGDEAFGAVDRGFHLFGTVMVAFHANGLQDFFEAQVIFKFSASLQKSETCIEVCVCSFQQLLARVAVPQMQSKVLHDVAEQLQQRVRIHVWEKVFGLCVVTSKHFGKADTSVHSVTFNKTLLILLFPAKQSLHNDFSFVLLNKLLDRQSSKPFQQIVVCQQRRGTRQRQQVYGVFFVLFAALKFTDKLGATNSFN